VSTATRLWHAATPPHRWDSAGEADR
jgi:hypothetical protein